MAVTCGDTELVALLRKLLDMACAPLDTNVLYDGLCQVECAEERIAITRLLQLILASAALTARSASGGREARVMTDVKACVRSDTAPCLEGPFDAAVVTQRMLGLARALHEIEGTKLNGDEFIAVRNYIETTRKRVLQCIDLATIRHSLS
jgi:hypothetical protein